MNPTIASFILIAVLALLSWHFFGTTSRSAHKPWRGSGLISAANSFYASVVRHAGVVRRLADNAVTTRCLIFKQGIAANSIDICGAADYPLGTVDNLLNAGDFGELELLGRGHTKPMVASGIIAAGVRVYTAAAGKIQVLPTAPGTYWLVGTALEAAAADGDYIEIADCEPVKLIVVAAQTSHTVATDDATDLASAEALANALKAEINKVIADVAAIHTAIGV